MPIDLKPLLDKAFFKEQPLKDVTLTIEKAADDFASRTNTDGRTFEVVAPEALDDDWVAQKLIRPLVYFCESEGRSIPRCEGVFVPLFVGDALYCIAASEVILWGSAQLDRRVDDLRDSYGTHELGHAEP